MNINMMFDENEKPLDSLVSDGGFCGIFRTIGCVGDSLSSGEFEGTDENGEKTYHDFYDYSWGQYIARTAGCKVYNFSRGGMTAKEYCESFAEANGFWDENKACQAYIVALGVNDLYGQKSEIGSVDDIDLNNCANNNKTFAGYYAEIVQRLKKIQPDAKFFFMTMPKASDEDAEKILLGNQHAKLMYDFTEFFENSYVVDLRKYAPVYDEQFKKCFYLGGHLNACGYVLTARMVSSYIDYIIRHNIKDFKQTGFIGTSYRNTQDID